MNIPKAAGSSEWLFSQPVSSTPSLAAHFVSLERGVVRSLLRSIEKSSHCFVVVRREVVELSENKLSEMKTKQSQSNSKRAPWRIFRRSSRRHDPMLLLNMTLFNFTDGWNRAFSREQYARFSV
jgi:hypothetical protein